MEHLPEYIEQCDIEGKKENEDELIQILSNCLDNGGDIDFIFPQCHCDVGGYRGTILHHSIINYHERVLQYALSRGANMAVKMTSDRLPLRYQSALEVAEYAKDPAVREIIKKRSLDLYSSFGLTSFHLSCAFQEDWDLQIEHYIEKKSAKVNAAISPESPIWPLMTPILIAAKFLNTDAVKRLLYLGADPIARDAEGNFPLHYIDEFLFDERLFARDATDTFGSVSGRSHFHIACRYCYQNTKALGIVKRYLDQGISPDLSIQICGNENDFDAGEVGLHIAANEGNLKLIQLLLEYGADINKRDLTGDSPIKYLLLYSSYHKFIKCLCLLIEGGSNMEKIDTNRLLDLMLKKKSSEKKIFLACIRKLITLNKDLVSENLMEVYLKVLEESSDWIEAEYASRCSKELKTLSGLGLRNVLDDTIIVRADFKDEFGWLDSFDFNAYSIYGRFLKIKAKRKLLEFEKKKKTTQL